MKKYAYISGKITGEPNLGKHKFEAAECLLKNEGYIPINPHKLPHDHDKRWVSYMKVCLTTITVSDCVFVMDCWSKSRGACVEVLIAVVLDIPVYEIATLSPLKLSFLKKINLFLNIF